MLALGVSCPVHPPSSFTVAPNDLAGAAPETNLSEYARSLSFAKRRFADADRRRAHPDRVYDFIRPAEARERLVRERRTRLRPLGATQGQRSFSNRSGRAAPPPRHSSLLPHPA